MASLVACVRRSGDGVRGRTAVPSRRSGRSRSWPNSDRPESMRLSVAHSMAHSAKRNLRTRSAPVQGPGRTHVGLDGVEPTTSPLSGLQGASDSGRSRRELPVEGRPCSLMPDVGIRRRPPVGPPSLTPTVPLRTRLTAAESAASGKQREPRGSEHSRVGRYRPLGTDVEQVVAAPGIHRGDRIEQLLRVLPVVVVLVVAPVVVRCPASNCPRSRDRRRDVRSASPEAGPTQPLVDGTPADVDEAQGLSAGPSGPDGPRS